MTTLPKCVGFWGCDSIVKMYHDPYSFFSSLTRNFNQRTLRYGNTRVLGKLMVGTFGMRKLWVNFWWRCWFEMEGNLKVFMQRLGCSDLGFWRRKKFWGKYVQISVLLFVKDYGSSQCNLRGTGHLRSPSTDCSDYYDPQMGLVNYLDT